MAWIPAAIGAGTSLISAFTGGESSTPPAVLPDSWDFSDEIKPSKGADRDWAINYADAARSQGQQGISLAEVDTARQQQDEMRGQYMDALAQMQARASGQDSVVLAQAQVERDKAQRAFASQLATLGGQGYYSPAVARQAQMQASGFQQQLAAQTAASAAQERQANLRAYLQGIGAGRQQDLGLMQQELAREAARQQYSLGMENVAANYIGQGVQAGIAGNQARQNYQTLRVNAANGNARLQQESAMAAQQRQQNYTMGFANAMAGLSGAMGANGGGNKTSGGSSSGGGSNGLIDPWK